MLQPILRVDLTTGEMGEMEIPEGWSRDYLGGASLAARILYADLKPDLHPLSPQAPLLFLNGPLTGTAGPAVGRFVVCGRSPATGLWAESNCGGFWGPELAMAGYSGMLITGRAEQPVYLWLNGGGDRSTRLELRQARHLWGKDTYQTQEMLATELAQARVRVAVIGPAGEAILPYALILCDHGRVAARTGMGAVMGSKNLKAIAVKGWGKVPLADPDKYMPVRAQSNRALRADPLSRVLHDLGSAGAADYFDYLGEMPKRYFRSGKLDQDLKISGAAVKETILVGETTCHACVIACGRLVELPESRASGVPASGVRRKGPEYETLVGFGPNLWLNDPVVATRLGELCDRYGMDSISVSNTIGLAFHLYERGDITERDTAGLTLKWGDPGVVEQLIHLAVRREGIGTHIAGGARALAGRFGAEGEAVQVNGLEVPYHDPRGSSGMALVYATSPRGACHNQSDYFMVDIGQAEASLGMEYFHPHAGAEKAANVVRHQDWRTVFNALVMCFFANVTPQEVVALINAACGLQLGIQEMMSTGERAWNLKRAINNRLGLTRQNDVLPQALLKPYLEDNGEQAGAVPDFPAMLRAYYEARGWDAATGYPSREKLISLGLEWVAQDLWTAEITGV